MVLKSVHDMTNEELLAEASMWLDQEKLDSSASHRLFNVLKVFVERKFPGVDWRNETPNNGTRSVTQTLVHFLELKGVFVFENDDDNNESNTKDVSAESASVESTSVEVVSVKRISPLKVQLLDLMKKCEVDYDEKVTELQKLEKTMNALMVVLETLD